MVEAAELLSSPEAPTDINEVLRLLAITKQLSACPAVQRARGWVSARAGLEKEENLAAISRILALCGPLTGCPLITHARGQVMWEQQVADERDAKKLRELIEKLENVHGGLKLDEARQVLAVEDSLSRIEVIEEAHDAFVIVEVRFRLRA